jgi:hypothetical protein
MVIVSKKRPWVVSKVVFKVHNHEYQNNQFWYNHPKEFEGEKP